MSKSWISARKTLVAIVLIVVVLGGTALYFTYFRTPPVVDTLKIGIVLEPNTFDPVYSMRGMQTTSYVVLVCEPLVRQHWDGTKFTLQNILIDSWNQVDDTTVDLMLKKGVSFTDGTQWDADAAKWNIDKMRNPKTPWGGTLLGPISEVSVLDQYTVRLITSKPFPALMANLGYHYNGVCSPTAAQKWGDQFASHPVGTGPYKLVKWDLSQGFLLERNDEYHGEKAKTKYLEFKIITDDASRAAALESGQVDVIDSPPPQKVSELLAEGFNVPSTKSVYVVDVWMNNQFGPLKDVRVRRALNYAVDKEAIKTMLGELVDISQSPISPTTWGYSPQAPYPYDPVMAKQLLAEAGYPDGFKIKMWGPQGKYLMDRQIAEAIVGYLSKVGVDVDLSILEWGSYVKIVYNKNATNQLFLHGWSDPTLDPDFRLSGNFYTKGSWWYLTKYDNSAVDRMLEEARYTVDQNSRMQLFADIQSQMWQDAPYIWLHSQREMLAMKSTVKGLFPVPTQYHDLAAAYMPAGSGPLALAGHTNYIAAVLAIVSFANSSLQRKKPFD